VSYYVDVNLVNTFVDGFIARDRAVLPMVTVSTRYPRHLGNRRKGYLAAEK